MSTPSAFTAQGGGSGIQGVSATLPLHSSGGQFPDISIVDAVPVPFGGSGNTSMPAFELIAGGVADVDPYQSIPSVNAGYVLTDNGPGALPTYQASPTSGSLTLLSTQTASNSASVTFTGLNATYFAYKIFIWGLYPAVNASNLIARLSTNNGISYDSGANYNWGYSIVVTSGVLTKNTALGDSGITIVADLEGTNAAAILQCEITLFNPFQSANTYLTTVGVYVEPASVVSTFTGGGAYTNASPVNAIEFLMSSGNITGGVFKLYGLAA